MREAEPATQTGGPDGDSQQDGGRQQDGTRERLDRLVGRASAALLWERAWPVLWRGLGVVLAFLVVSWLGLWLDIAPAWRMAGLAVFALALIAALAPLVRLRRPARGLALDRLDRDGGVGNRPARSMEDTLALGSDDPGTRLLWELHRRRAAAAIGRLRVARPSPGMARRDRFALRGAALLATVAAAFVAGPEIGERLRAAFVWQPPAAGAAPFRVDGWIDPPLYTRLPPLIVTLAGGEQRLRAPARSTLVIRVAGQGEATITPGKGLTPIPASKEQKPDLREERFTLSGGPADLTVKTGLATQHRLVVDTIPDRPPEIALSGPPEVNARGTFTLAYKAKDDYGIASAEGLVEKAQGGQRRSLVPAPRIGLTTPADIQGETETKTLVDLTTHPWAGAKVKLTLVARDEAEQEGRSEAADFTLPQRPFTKPLAKALVEERRRIVLDPDGDRRRVQTALDALLIAPDQFTPQWGVFMGLRAVAARLRVARTDADLTEVADFLWTMALQIEDGDLSDAERDLRAAQDRLREAMERGAPDEEIRRLTDDLRAALDKFLREFAERMQRDQQQSRADPQQQSPDRVITRDDLEKMLNQMQEAMRKGDMAEAQRLLDQLRGILENLQAGRPNSRMSDPMAREMNRSMEELEGMAREQQQLRDETFRQGQEKRMGRNGRQQQGQRGQQGQQGQRGQRGQQGQQGQQGDGDEQAENGQGQGQQGGTGQRQQALRERLQEMQRRMREYGMQGEQGLSDAEQAMREAENSLGQGQDGPAVDAQGRALEGLQRGAQGMAQQMQQMMGQGDGQDDQPGGQQPGNGMPNQQGRANGRDNDPLGRPTRGRDFSDGRVRVPTADESGVERARRIMEELRRKLGDPNRAREELDYFERLLRRN